MNSQPVFSWSRHNYGGSQNETKNSWTFILVVRFCVNYTYFEFLEDKFIKKDCSINILSLGSF